MSRRVKSYPLNHSVFYRIPGPNRLAATLLTSERKLSTIREGEPLYTTFLKSKKGGGSRLIEAPRPDLKKIQRRIADLLQAIAPPDYLFAPVRGRSYLDNAARHRGAPAFHLLDVQDFFPSCTARKVAWFFGTVMECPADVAAIMVRLTTHEGRLPQGSPCSPILAYLAYKDMWDEIAALVEKDRCRLSVYADDLTISGLKIPGRLIHAIKERFAHHGHQYAVDKEASSIHKPLIVTGAVVSRTALLLPNSKRKAMYELKKRAASTPQGSDRERMMRSLKGSEDQARQFEQFSEF